MTTNHASGALLLGALLLACRNDPAPAPKAAASATPTPSAAAAVADGGGKRPPAEKVELPELHVRPDAPTTVAITWSVPEGTGLNDDAPFRVRWNRSDGLAEVPPDAKTVGNAVKDGFKIAVQPMPGAPNATLGGEIDLVVCDVATHSICVPVRRALEIGFQVAKDAPAIAKITIPLPRAK